MEPPQPPSDAAATAKPGRNDSCPCGSGRKYKFCCAATGPAGRKDAAILAAPPVSAQGVIQAAARLLRAGKYEDAIAPLLEATRLAPFNASVLSDLGLAYLHCRRPSEAIPWLRRSLALRPNFAATYYHLGAALEETGADGEALAAYQRAIALNPKLAKAHARIATFLVAKGARSKAAEAYDRAAAAAGDTIFGQLFRINALMARDQTEEAERRARRLIERNPASGDAHRLLGNLLGEAGHFDEAVKHLERSIALQPQSVSDYSHLVAWRRLTEADRPLISRMLSRLEDRDLSGLDRMSVHFALGKALDDLEDNAGAMRHFDAANEIRHGLCRFDRNEIERRIDRLIERFTGDFFAANRAIGGDDATPVLVLGMPRSGTTLTERIISSHSRVAGGGEVEFWTLHGAALVTAATDTLTAAAGRLQSGYRRMLRGVSPNALRVTDKMPFNFLWLGLIHLNFPNARVIHCRRNPIDTCLSIYTNLFSTRWEFSGDRGDLAFYYRQYLRLMDHWRSVLPPDRLLDVDYEQLIADPERCARRLIAFCGLHWEPACLQPEHNHDRVRTASAWQARQPIYRGSVERWRRYEPWLGELRTLLPADAGSGAPTD
jgi:tetratricopeptide (TPR) repeat protein